MSNLSNSALLITSSKTLPSKMIIHQSDCDSCSDVVVVVGIIHSYSHTQLSLVSHPLSLMFFYADHKFCMFFFERRIILRGHSHTNVLFVILYTCEIMFCTSFRIVKIIPLVFTVNIAPQGFTPPLLMPVGHLIAVSNVPAP